MAPSDSPKNRDAFSELMSQKPEAMKQVAGPDRRDGLLAYVESPASFPGSRVLYHTDDFVAIHDLYPKSTVHLLLLPRDPSKFLLHPFDALADPVFLSAVRAEATKLKGLAASELARLLSAHSQSDRERRRAMEVEPPLEELPPGRDWAAEIRVGIHAHPSMNHLHIHLLSRDMHSDCLKHRKHYHSFNTPFFIPLDDFPLREDDVRRHPGHEGYLQRDFVCWRCGKGFGNRFKALKEHLEVEFREWRKE